MVALLAVPLLAAAGQAGFGATAPRAQMAPGDPLPGLDASQSARFQEGKSLFSRVFFEDGGLGPRFNETACNACHTDPADGGIGDQFLVRASRTADDGTCDLLATDGGLNVQNLVTRRFEGLGGVRLGPPEAATGVGRFSVPPLFGLGLVEAIPETALLKNVDPEDRNGDGISGRLGADSRGRPARFGRKGDHATLRSFVAAAALHEMGLTSPDHPVEPAVTGAEHPPAADPAGDPELTESDIQALTDFVRYLAPVAPKVPREREVMAQVAEGDELFAAIGCTGCHVPTFTTGDNPVRALARKPVRTYSDFLLHDMGDALEGPCGPGSNTREYRTEPLVGLSSRLTYLHDGRAGGILEAVLLHGGEAQAARDAFSRLDRVTQESIVQFLRTL